MPERIIKKLSENKTLSLASYLTTKITPNFKKIKKYKNALLAAHYIHKSSPIIKNNPINVRIAPISICNYKCLFCEIHKDNLLYPHRLKNIFTIQNIKNYGSFLSTAWNIGFFGGSAEPLLNPDFGKIVYYLKLNYNPKLMVNTNASVLTQKLSDIFVECKFNDILVSYHAGTKNCYHYLTSGCGNIDIVDKNLQYLAERKTNYGRDKPKINFNFALQKINSKEFKPIFDKAKKFHVNQILISKYYGGRNKLQDKKVSFDYNPKKGNHILDEIYDYAKKNNLNLFPKKPAYWNEQNKKIEWNPENYNTSKKCLFPWLNLQFDPVLDEENCHYVGICNRIILFKINYNKLKLSSQENFDKLWNHPLLQCMRNTVNLNEPNPICKYCKNCQRESLRNVNADKYAEIRDKAVKDFFVEFKKNYVYDKINGLEVLSDNPYSDKKFKNKLKKMKK